MFSENTQTLLTDVSKNVQGIGRRIGSTKNDLDDLRTLARALEMSKTALEVIYRTELDRL